MLGLKRPCLAIAGFVVDAEKATNLPLRRSPATSRRTETKYKSAPRESEHRSS
jgi:hypothetical protein